MDRLFRAMCEADSKKEKRATKFSGVLTGTALPTSGKVSRDRAIFACVYLEGLRPKQVKDLCVCDFTGETLFVEHMGYCKKSGELPLQPPTREAIEGWLFFSGLRGGDVLFPNRYGEKLSGRSIRRSIKSVIAQSGIAIPDSFSLVTYGKGGGLEGRAIIYFVQIQPGRQIKIGWTTDLEKRIAQIKNSLPEKKTLNILGTMEGTRRDEGRLHKRFAELKTRGEWYNPTRDLLLFIREQGKDETRTPNN